jgi:hypothetical protein
MASGGAEGDVSPQLNPGVLAQPAGEVDDGLRAGATPRINQVS